MSKLSQLMSSYRAYHTHRVNMYFHFLGVPVVTFSLFLFLAWFRFVAPSFPISLAQVFFVCVSLYYIKLDKEIGLYVMAAFGVLVFVAEICARLEFSASFLVFLICFTLGWALQFIGHYFEGRKPALFDNIFQAFNAPLFVVVEILFLLGKRKELEAEINSF